MKVLEADVASGGGGGGGGAGAGGGANGGGGGGAAGYLVGTPTKMIGCCSGSKCGSSSPVDHPHALLSPTS